MLLLIKKTNLHQNKKKPVTYSENFVYINQYRNYSQFCQ